MFLTHDYSCLRYIKEKKSKKESNDSREPFPAGCFIDIELDSQKLVHSLDSTAGEDRGIASCVLSVLFPTWNLSSGSRPLLLLRLHKFFGHILGVA